MTAQESDNMSPLDPAEVLSAVEASIANYGRDGGQKTISVGGVSFSYATLDELFKLRNFWQRKVDEASGKRRRGKGYRIAAIMPV